MTKISGHDFMVFVAGKPVAQFVSAEAAALYITRHAGVLPNARIREISYRPDPYWITVDGRVLAYEEIQDDHLVNILHRIANGKTSLDDKTVKALCSEAIDRCYRTPKQPLHDRLQAGIDRVAVEWPKILAVRQAAARQRPGTLEELEAGAVKAKAAREKKPKAEPKKIEDENTRRLKALADELTGGGDK